MNLRIWLRIRKEFVKNVKFYEKYCFLLIFIGIIYVMKSSWFPTLMIVALLGLLVFLATLQYQWLGQISDAEKVRLEERLKDDTKRFADDFNEEIQNAYYPFKFTEDDWGSFNNRYKAWKQKTNYPSLITSIHFVKTSKENELNVYNEKNGNFEKADWNKKLSEIKTNFKNNNFERYSEKHFALIIPIYKRLSDFKKVLSNTKRSVFVKDKNGKTLTENIVGPEASSKNVENILKRLKIPDKDGFLIIDLNEDVIKTKILPTLAKKYFSESDGGSYKLSIVGKDKNTIFQTHKEALDKDDAQAKLFNLNPENFFFFSNSGEIPLERKVGNGRVVFSNSVSARTVTKMTDSSGRNGTSEVVDVDITSDNKPVFRVFENKGKESEGLWTFKVQHVDGSLEQFITNTRQRNLAVSFGILSLLAVSIILIFISSQRAKNFALKQMDFVSSVSHEFRTPLAVIYSAGENLSDGVVEDQTRVVSYGNLLKREGKKLSGMVEQILEFAGANSGKRKYDFRETDISMVIENSIRECEPILLEKNFEIEKEIAENLPKIKVDEKALTQAVQNLINNSIKYSNGTKWLKITAKNGDGNLKLSVEDKGIGISKSDQRQIFEPFYRSKEVVDDQISGNGLGLSLVEQIVDAHKGKIEVKSEIHKGSKFTIHLPVNN